MPNLKPQALTAGERWLRGEAAFLGIRARPKHPSLAYTTTYSSVGGTTYPDAQIVLGALGPLHMRPSKLKRRT